jgi:hypothetical protein
MAPKKGNKNALKHGLYSKHISVIDDVELLPMSGTSNADELALARVRLDTCLLKQKSATKREDWLAYENAIIALISQIAGMVHANAVLGKDQRAAFVSILDMIRVTNDKQDVK